MVLFVCVHVGGGGSDSAGDKEGVQKDLEAFRFDDFKDKRMIHDLVTRAASREDAASLETSNAPEYSKPPLVSCAVINTLS